MFQFLPALISAAQTAAQAVGTQAVGAQAAQAAQAVGTAAAAPPAIPMGIPEGVGSAAAAPAAPAAPAGGPMGIFNKLIGNITGGIQRDIQGLYTNDPRKGPVPTLTPPPISFQRRNLVRQTPFQKVVRPPNG